MKEVILGVIVVAFLLNLIVSIVLLKRSDFERTQKILQLMLIWLFPFIGSVGFWLLYRSIDKGEKLKYKISNDPINRSGVNQVDITD